MILVDYHKDGMYGCWIVDDSVVSESEAIGGVPPSSIHATPDRAVKWAEKMSEGDEMVVPSEIVHGMVFNELGHIE